MNRSEINAHEVLLDGGGLAAGVAAGAALLSPDELEAPDEAEAPSPFDDSDFGAPASEVGGAADDDPPRKSVTYQPEPLS